MFCTNMMAHYFKGMKIYLKMTVHCLKGMQICLRMIVTVLNADDDLPADKHALVIFLYYYTLQHHSAGYFDALRIYPFGFVCTQESNYRAYIIRKAYAPQCSSSGNITV